MKPCSSSTSDLSKKIVLPDRALVLALVFDSDMYEAPSVQLETVRLNGVCTVDLTKTLLDTVHKLSEQVAVLNSDNASLKSQINKLHENVGEPQGPLSTRVGLQADKEIADPSETAPRRNLDKSYAAVAVSGSAHTASRWKEFADRAIPRKLHPLFLRRRFLPSKNTVTVSRLSPTERRQPLEPLR
jgi:hypothetical protein